MKSSRKALAGTPTGPLTGFSSSLKHSQIYSLAVHQVLEVLEVLEDPQGPEKGANSSSSCVSVSLQHFSISFVLLHSRIGFFLDF